MDFELRAGTPADVPAALPLFPRLADYDVPAERDPRDLWAGDAKLLQDWAQGKAPQCLFHVAAGSAGQILAIALASLGKEHLSGAPSAHLEAIAVSPEADGHGVGRALLDHIEQAAIERGAQTMTLHVFGNNQRARHVYGLQGYSEELIRCIKHFSS